MYILIFLSYICVTNKSYHVEEGREGMTKLSEIELN